ncbi:MAG: hypothetical protein Q9159_000568 [Coniocarpon cinnabarinum]
MERTIRTLQEELRRIRREMAAQKVLNARLEGQKEDLRHEYKFVSVLKNENEDLKRENKLLKVKALNYEVGSAQLQKENKKLRSDVEVLENERMALSDEVTRLHDDKHLITERYIDANYESEDRLQEIDDVNVKYTLQESAAIFRLTQLEDVKKSMSKLCQSNGHLQKCMDGAVLHAQVIASELNGAREDLGSMTQHCRDVESQLELAQVRRDEAWEEVEKLRGELYELHERIGALGVWEVDGFSVWWNDDGDKAAPGWSDASSNTSKMLVDYDETEWETASGCSQKWGASTDAQDDVSANEATL